VYLKLNAFAPESNPHPSGVPETSWGYGSTKIRMAGMFTLPPAGGHAGFSTNALFEAAPVGSWQGQ
jgi:hypothetical protein